MDKALFMLFDMGLTMLLIIIIVFIAIFAVHINQFNTFEDQAQDVISRSGGFTQQVQDELNKQAEAYYKAGGVYNSSSKQIPTMFRVEPINYSASSVNNESGNELVDKPYNPDAYKVKENESVQYGKPIYYRVVAQIPLIPTDGKTSLIFNLKPYSNNVKNGDGEVQEVNSEVREGSTCFVNNNSNSNNVQNDTTCSSN